MDVKMYFTSVTASREVKTKQNDATLILQSKSVPFTSVDISQDHSILEEMRTKVGNPKATPPQFFNGDQYCGDFDMLKDAAEDDKVKEFLKLNA